MKAKISRGGKLSAVFLFIFAVLGISLNLQTPTIDATPDRVDFAAFDEMSLADTLDLPERAPNVNISDTYTAPAVRSYTSTTTSYSSETRTNSISILGRTIDIFVSSDTRINAGSMVARYINGSKYRGQFYYGHNSAQVFGGLANLSVGSTFTINLDGTDYYYRIAKIETVVNDDTLASNMKKVASGKDYNGAQYDVTLMTCAGTPYGDGNATHRTIVYAYLD
jgi:LPXTG-site transpeptidase (sortase) family protein